MQILKYLTTNLTLKVKYGGKMANLAFSPKTIHIQKLPTAVSSAAAAERMNEKSQFLALGAVLTLASACATTVLKLFAAACVTQLLHTTHTHAQLQAGASAGGAEVAGGMAELCSGLRREWAGIWRAVGYLLPPPPGPPTKNARSWVRVGEGVSVLLRERQP